MQIAAHENRDIEHHSQDWLCIAWWRLKSFFLLRAGEISDFVFLAIPRRPLYEKQMCSSSIAPFYFSSRGSNRIWEGGKLTWISFRISLFCVREYYVSFKLKIFVSFILLMIREKLWCIPKLVISTISSYKWKRISSCFWDKLYDRHIYVTGAAGMAPSVPASQLWESKFLKDCQFTVAYVWHGIITTQKFCTHHSPPGISDQETPQCYRRRSLSFNNIIDFP